VRFPSSYRRLQGGFGSQWSLKPQEEDQYLDCMVERRYVLCHLERLLWLLLFILISDGHQVGHWKGNHLLVVVVVVVVTVVPGA